MGRVVTILLVIVTIFTFKGVCQAVLQTCRNCDQLTCSQLYNVSATSEYACGQACSTNGSCQSAVFKPPDCVIYSCDTVHHSLNHELVYRKSLDSSCPKYEVYKLDDYKGSCPVSQSTNGVSMTTCLTSCLDTTGCTAVSYNTATTDCQQHTSCDDILADSSFVFFRRHCEIPCDTNRTFIQTCKNCVPVTTCTAYQTTAVINVTSCNDTCQADPACVMADYDNGYCKLYDCTRVDFTAQLYGTNMHRLSCNDGCNVYHLTKNADTTVSCTPSLAEQGGYPADYCIERCLDIIDCLAVSHDRTTMSCYYYTTSTCSTPSTSPSSGTDTFLRTCTEPDRTYNQTCLNCKPADSCTSYATSGELSFEPDCFEYCINDYGSCHIAQYSPDDRRCRRYTCSDVQEEYGNRTFRLSFTPDCAEYEIHTYADGIGSCSTLSEEDAITDSAQCLRICLDKPGCRSASFVTTNGTCFTYTCTDMLPVVFSTIFMVRECFPWSSCHRNHTQYCHNCSPSPEWERGWYREPNSTLLHTCDIDDYRLENGVVSAQYQRFSIPTCNFSLSIDLKVEYGYGAVRRTCSTDCPEYSLLALYNYTTSGTEMDSETGIPRYEACLQRCVDRDDGCRCITFDEITGECKYFSDCDDTTRTQVTAGESKVHVIRTCNVTEPCQRTYTQTCINCRMGYGCSIGYESESSTVDNNCTMKPWWNFSNTFASQYVREQKDPRCRYYPCGNVAQAKSVSRIVYRRSCVSDCPVFELEEYSDYTASSGCVSMGDSGWHKIPNSGYCMDECLNLAGCVAISFSWVDRLCVYYSSCPAAASIYDGHYEKIEAQGFVFVERICTTIDTTPRTVLQTCHNCQYGPGCQWRTSVKERFKSYECPDAFNCLSNSNCGSLYYDTVHSSCFMMQCLELTRKAGGIVTRRTYSTDVCSEYELFIYTSSTGVGVCATSEPAGFVNYHRRAISAQACMNKCLDINGCRGTTYDQDTMECFHSVCDTYVSATNKTFVKRLCASDFPVCNRTQLQQCTNCRADPWACQYHYDHVVDFTPHDVSLALFNTDPDLKLLWYDHRFEGGSWRYVQCQYVFQGMGHTVYRPTCSTDCLKFEVFYKWKHVGDPSAIITTLEGGLTLNYCVDKCLDMDGCRGVTYRNWSLSCDLHSTTLNTPYTGNSPRIFAWRNCINESAECVPNVIQTCINCRIGDECQSPFDTRTNIILEKDSRAFKETVAESEAVWYIRNYGVALSYQCSQVGVNMHDIVYRESCNTVCQKYELFHWNNRSSTCPVIGSDEGGVSLGYCVEKCLEMPTCMAVSYNTTTFYHRCDYHDCTGSSYTTTIYDNTAIWVGRRCIPDCQKVYLQRCMNCDVSTQCQSPIQTFTVPTVEECNTTLINDADVDLVHYDVISGTCNAYNCSLVTHKSFHETFRWSCSDDCPLYEIYTIKDRQGNGFVTDIDSGSVDEAYCIDKCLSTSDCRAVTYLYGNTDSSDTRCMYHNGTGYETLAMGGYSSSSFTKRICLSEPGPEKPHLETCLNCDSRCSVTLPSNYTIGTVYEAGKCKPVSINATSAVFDTSRTCQETRCDAPTRDSTGSVVTRRAINSTCATYDLIWTKSTAPSCTHIDLLELWNLYRDTYTNDDVLFCIRRCLDTPGCLTIRLTWWRCYLYDCLEESGSYSEVMTIRKYCRDNCTTFTEQICLNCRIGTGCPATFQGNLTTNCLFSMGNEANVGALELRNGVCNKYECREIQPDSASKVHRKACHDDCPVYEIYTKVGVEGLCTEITREYQTGSQYQCLQRCLDTPGCRAARYYTPTSRRFCVLYTCDCHTESTDSDYIFMWKYCLNDVSQASNQTEITLTGKQPRVYPNSSCILPPTTTPAPTTTPLPMVFPLANETSNGNVTPIYIWPCPCGGGLLTNMTEEEWIRYFTEQLWINTANLSKTRRRYECAVDDRESAQTMGYGGAVMCFGVVGAIMIMDITYLLKAFRQLRTLCKDGSVEQLPKKPRRVKKPVPKQVYLRP